MARKDENILGFLSKFPWWVSIFVGIAVYVGLKFVIPSIAFGNPVLKGMALVAPSLALVSLLFLLPAAFSAFRVVPQAQAPGRPKRNRVYSLIVVEGIRGATCGGLSAARLLCEGELRYWPRWDVIRGRWCKSKLILTTEGGTNILGVCRDKQDWMPLGRCIT